jgi:hypothetical protein
MKTIHTKYHGATNYRGSRISATDGDRTIYISYPHELSGDAVHDAAFFEFMHRSNWSGVYHRGHTKTGCVYVCECSDSAICVPKNGKGIVK